MGVLHEPRTLVPHTRVSQSTERRRHLWHAAITACGLASLTRDLRCSLTRKVTDSTNTKVSALKHKHFEIVKMVLDCLIKEELDGYDPLSNVIRNIWTAIMVHIE